ncbi:uncharacterized protein [Elaeis guineensis]|uniref:Uncharacterized protein LOC105040372 n=1 Tax=Elaeis guineensis var. tenera TaxID=51953 RepID=A0A6I9QVU5_ELAGV|nr:uncharacterized protein LOC105040372 [Elaeis guineensis]XP_029118984.1 uncharacterized protein LOC105040372 [Elaeis guineensis]
MAALPALTAYKILFATLGCFMVATLIYTLATDGSPFRLELLTPWMAATLVDFYVNVVAIVVWVAYRESKLIHTVLWIVLLVCFGSIATCAYIVKKLFVISPADVKDPVSRVLLRNDDECKLKFSSVMFGRILFSVLGVLVLATVVSTIIIDGFPFQKELLTPWMAATLIDFYINVIAISVWVAHKESTWISALFWICLLICFGSIATCTYIVLQLFQLSYQDSMYHILLDSHSKHGSTSSK